MVVHLYGQACDMNKISKICKDNKLYIIEDAAEAFGSKLNGKFLGTFGDVGCFSFFGNKQFLLVKVVAAVVKRKKNLQ